MTAHWHRPPLDDARRTGREYESLRERALRRGQQRSVLDQRVAGLIESLSLPTVPFTDAFGCLASHRVALTRSAPGSAPVIAMLPVTRDVARANVTSPVTRTSSAKRAPCRTILSLRSVNVPPRRPRPFLPVRRNDW